jgi:hypothetical protein
MEGMAQGTVIRFLLGALLLAGAAGLATAQDEVGPQDLTRSTADPVEKLVGLWRVDKVEGTAPPNVAAGQVLKIDRQSVETLTRGSCSNPSFGEQLGSITVSCLGQDLASAAWNPEAPGTLQWSEGNLHAVLSRISGTEALGAPSPAAEDLAPAADEAVPAEDEAAPAEDEGEEEPQ